MGNTKTITEQKSITYTVGKLYIVNFWPKVCTHVFNGRPHFGIGNWGDDWSITEATEELLIAHAKQVCAVNSKETVTTILCVALPEVAPYYQKVLTGEL